MGLFDKIAFWRKEPELPDVSSFGKESGFKGAGGYGESGFGKSGFGAGQKGSGFDSVGLGDESFPTDIEPGMPEIEPGYGGGPGLQQQEPQFGAPLQRPRQQQWQRPQQPFGAPMQPMQPSNQMEMTMTKDFEIVSSKLDMLKATLDGINQRLENLERLSQDKRNRW